MDTVWSDLHEDYKTKDWINKPSLFAETAITYFPATGKILDLGAGQGQDSRFFAEHGYQVISTDLEESALEQSKTKLTDDLKPRVTLQKVDLRDELPFADNSFDVVYAHLSLHYFNADLTARIFFDIERVLKPNGIFAFFVNSTSDPEYGTGTKLEEDYFQIDKTTKRYFSIASARKFARFFDVNLLDDHGETYKDRDKGVHNLIRFVGTKPSRREEFNLAIPCTGAIIERNHDGEREVLIQTRWRLSDTSIYNGTFEFPIGKLDKPYENIFDTLSREIREECGLKLKSVKDLSKTGILSVHDDAMMGFRPFCCTQQLKEGKPWISFIFVCEVEDGEPTPQVSEAKDAHWMKVAELRKIYTQSPERLFGLQLPAWDYYLNARED